MPSRSRPDRRSHATGFTPVFLANLLPVVGVLWLDWNPATLVAIYAAELLFTFPLAGVKALFAGRPPRTDREEDEGVITVTSDLAEKRGSVQPVAWLPPIYPRNLPFATAVVGAAAWFAIVIGVVLADVFAFGSVLARPEVVVSVAALAVGQAVETWRDYLGGAHESASPYAVIETPARQAFFLAFLLFVAPVAAAVGLSYVLVLVVVGKLLVEWSAYRATHDGDGDDPDGDDHPDGDDDSDGHGEWDGGDDEERGSGGRLTDWLAGPDAPDESPDPVAVPDREPDASVQTHGRTVLLAGLCHVLAERAPFYAMPFLIVWLLSVALLGDAAPVAGVAAGVVVAAAFVAFLVAAILEHYLCLGPVEYRRYGDRVVACDTLLDEPQWSTPLDVLRDVDVVPDSFPERLLDTRTVTATTGWGDDETRRRIGPVDDPEALVEGFDLPVQSTDLESLDRRPVAVVVACLVALGAAVVTIVFGPWFSAGELFVQGIVYGVFGLPFLALVLRLVWVQAYPRRSEVEA